MAVEKINVPPAFHLIGTLHLPKTGQRFFLGTFLYRDRRSVSLLTRLPFLHCRWSSQALLCLLHTVSHGRVMHGAILLVHSVKNEVDTALKVTGTTFL